MNNSAFTAQDVAKMYGVVDVSNEISTATYNGMQYFKCILSTEGVASKVDLPDKMVQMICFLNGYVHIFQFTGTESSKYYPDFEKLLNSVTYPGGATALDNAPRSPVADIIKNLPRGDTERFFVTFLLYAIPMLIYRYGIKRAPVGKKKGRWISIIYLIISVLSSGLVMQAVLYEVSMPALFMGGFINYFILTRGYIEKLSSPQLPQI